MKNDRLLRPPEYEDHFQLPEEDLRCLLGIGMSSGADLAEIFLEYRLYHFVTMEEDILKETAESISLGMGIRVLKDDQTGYAYSNDMSLAALKKAARTAASIATGGGTGPTPPFRTEASPLAVSLLERPLSTVPLNSKIDLVKRAYASAQSHDSDILKVKVVYTDQMQYVRILNSEGLSRSDTRPLVKLTCVALAERNGLREAGYSGGGGRVGLEYFSDTLTPEAIGKAAAAEAIHLLEASSPPAGEMPVVLAPGHSGVLIHEAVGHLLEADFNRRKTSIFWDKQGRTVGSEQVTIHDDPTIPLFRGSYNIDDEGTVPQKTTLIRKGRVVGLLQDRLSARLMGTSPTGHGRRQDFTCYPIPRMSNTFIDRGDVPPEDILRSVSKGFYALHYQGGQVEDSGKFTFSVSSGFLIEGGRLTRPVKQATLIGSNIDILKKIEMVGSDLEFGLQTGTCGKEGQAAPVSDGCPTLKISRMTIGGQN